jgi:nitrite reductase/ring-hydroxylating ferredoxin subunit
LEVPQLEIDMSDAPETTGPDLTLGVAADSLADGQMRAGHVGEDAVLLARRGNEFFAVGATCTHYNGPLAEGLMVDDTVRCPWHHACFSLRTGEALRAPALGPIACWSTEQRDGKVFVRQKLTPAPSVRVMPAPGAPRRIVIVGGGAAGFAAAEMLRRERYQGSIVMLTDDDAPPVDRPNLSKDYLAGSAPEDWVPLREDRLLHRTGHRLAAEDERQRGRYRSSRRRARRRDEYRLRPAAARHRRGAGAIADPGDGPAARAHVANPR